MDSLSDPRDPSKWSAEDLITMGFVNTPELMALLEDTPQLADLDLDGYDAIMVAGGLSPMLTYRDSEPLKDAIRHFYEDEKPTAIYCHGTAALVDLKLSDGSYLVAGRTVTGFSNAEEEYSDRFVGQTGDAVADRGRDEGARRQLRPGRPVQGVHGPRRQADHRPAAVLGPEGRADGDRSPRPVGLDQKRSRVDSRHRAGSQAPSSADVAAAFRANIPFAARAGVASRRLAEVVDGGIEEEGPDRTVPVSERSRSLLVLLTGAVTLYLVAAPSALADRSFSARFSANANGDIAVIGNTLETCSSAAARRRARPRPSRSPSAQWPAPRQSARAHRQRGSPADLPARSGPAHAARAPGTPRRGYTRRSRGCSSVG